MSVEVEDTRAAVVIDGQVYEFEGRAGLMLREFVYGRDAVDDVPASGRGRVTFDFDRDEVSLSVERFVVRRRLAPGKPCVVRSPANV